MYIESLTYHRYVFDMPSMEPCMRICLQNRSFRMHPIDDTASVTWKGFCLLSVERSSETETWPELGLKRPRS